MEDLSTRYRLERDLDPIKGQTTFADAFWVVHRSGKRIGPACF